MQDFDRNDLVVHVAFNGVDRAPDVSPHAWPLQVRVTHRREPNIGAAKNQAIDAATGEYLLLLNDDVIARPDFVRRHVETHRKLARPAMVLGKSAWERYRDQTVLDEMIAATPMIFFYDRMASDHWYGFRHAWNLNLSLPRAALGRLRFDERLGPFFYEDLELAYRLDEQHGVRVWYEPTAEVLHAHRYTFDGYLDRESAMGLAAVRLAEANPDCFRAIYGTALDDDYLRFMSAAVQHDGRHESQRIARLRQWANRPALTLPTDAEARQEVLDLLYDAHLPLKRLAFRRGVIAAAEAKPRTPATRMSDPKDGASFSAAPAIVGEALV